MRNFVTRSSIVIFELIILSALFWSINIHPAVATTETIGTSGATVATTVAETVTTTETVATAEFFNKYDIEWDDAVSGTLYRGDALSNGEYTVKAAQFSSPVPGIKNMQGNIVPDDTVYPMVYLSIYKGGVLIKEIVMGAESDPYIDPDYELKVTVGEFLKRNSRDWVYEYYNPWAIVSVQTRAKPKLEVEIVTDKTIYTSHRDSIISAKVKVINSGQAFIENVDVNFSVDLGKLKLRGGDIRQLSQHYERMDKNSVQSFMVVFVVPELIDETSYDMNVDARGYDIKDIAYNATDYSSVIVTPEQNYLTINKALKDRIYLDDNETVKIAVANGGIYDAYNISVTDGMNENFELSPYVPLQWNIPVLKPGEEWHTTYFIRPMKANLNGFVMPEATARFTVNNRQYSLSSDKTKVIVNGPIIVIGKTANKSAANIGEDVKIIVTVNNIGSMPTKAEIKDLDPLPDGVSFVSGDRSISPTFLELNTPQRFSYVVRGNVAGNIQLPPVTVRYVAVEYRGIKWMEDNSTGPNIIFKDQNATNQNGKNSSANNNEDLPDGQSPISKTSSYYIIGVVAILAGAFVWRRLY